MAEIEVGLPRAVIWEGLRDLRRARFYVPDVTDIVVTTPQHEGVGASRRVFTKSRGFVDETVIAWRDGEGLTLRLHNGEAPPAPFPAATFEYALAERGADWTLLSCIFEYGFPWGAVGPLAHLLLFRPIIGKSLRATAQGFKGHYETGAVTNTAYSGPPL
jgi:hypothetical protein